MNAPTSATRPTKAAIAFAGEEIPAKVYAEVDGTTVVIDTLIRVRAMPARHLGRVLQLCLDEGALLEFVCLEPCTSESPVDPALGTVFSGWQRVLPGWADNLTDESHAALLEAAQRLNFTRAASWGERQVKAKQFQTPLILMAKETLLPMVDEMVGSVLSRLKSLESQASPTTTSSTATPCTS